MDYVIRRGENYALVDPTGFAAYRSGAPEHPLIDFAVGATDGIHAEMRTRHRYGPVARFFAEEVNRIPEGGMEFRRNAKGGTDVRMSPLATCVPEASREIAAASWGSTEGYRETIERWMERYNRLDGNALELPPEEENPRNSRPANAASPLILFWEA